MPAQQQALTLAAITDNPFMNITYFLLFVFTFFLSCHNRQDNFQSELQDIRENFSKEAKKHNAPILKWEAIIDRINKIALVDKKLAIKKIDSLLTFDSSINRTNTCDLHFIKGDLLYQLDSSKSALEEFSKSDPDTNMTFAKIWVAKAGVYLKMKENVMAEEYLRKASENSYEYYWNLGNYFEILKKKDSAIVAYQRLYVHDTIFYKYCNDRIIELHKNNPQYLTELVFKDRERKVLLLY